jgi:hypothetical protein
MKDFGLELNGALGPFLMADDIGTVGPKWVLQSKKSVAQKI